MIPRLEISPNWFVDEITTIDQCNDADAVLTQAISTVEGQIATAPQPDPQWLRKATFALKMKRAALQAVQRKRGDLRRETGVRLERKFLNTIRDQHPDVYRQTMELIT